MEGNEVKQWEYKKLGILTEEQLNKFGEQGWEVTGTFSNNSGNTILLKRPKQKVVQRQTEPDYGYGR